MERACSLCATEDSIEWISKALKPPVTASTAGHLDTLTGRADAIGIRLLQRPLHIGWLHHTTLGILPTDHVAVDGLRVRERQPTRNAAKIFG